MGALHSIVAKLIAGALLIVLVSLFLAFFISARIGKPISEFRSAVGRFSEGNLKERVQSCATKQLNALSDSLNRMAAVTDERLNTLQAEKNEQEAVLASMVEGVLAFDSSERLISINQAAARMLELDGVQAIGRYIQEPVRNPQLQKFISAALASSEPLDSEIVYYGANSRILQAYGRTLLGIDARPLGALIVLNDVSRIRHLKNLRRDFVANVSHELKTPITSIKGFVETLRDGAMNDPTDAGRFLAIIAKQTDRLNSIIEDLLSLSRIEEETQKRQVALVKAPIRKVLQGAMQTCEAKAAAKNIRLDLDCPQEVMANANVILLEQAVVNLLDNAIKYSDDGKTVRVCGRQNDNGVTIAVSDQGWGIEKKHLPRLFERFYRVDKARSRDLGGTGLGLAIVKHIAIAHGGNVSVESAPGSGSTFSIHLPLPSDSRETY